MGNIIAILILLGLCSFFVFVIFAFFLFLPIHAVVLYCVGICCVMYWIFVYEKTEISEFIIPVICMTFVNTGVLLWPIEFNMEYIIVYIMCLIVILCSAAPFCFIASKLAIFKQNIKIKRIKVLRVAVNEFYDKKIDDINNVIAIIQNKYSDENKIEKLLILLDSLSNDDLKARFIKRTIESNQELVIDIKNILLSYSIDINIERKTLSDVLDELKSLKHEYNGKKYLCKSYDLKLYKEIKDEYKMICKGKSRS